MRVDAMGRLHLLERRSREPKASTPTITPTIERERADGEVDQRGVDARAEPGDGVRDHDELGRLDVDGLCQAFGHCGNIGRWCSTADVVNRGQTRNSPSNWSLTSIAAYDDNDDVAAADRPSAHRPT